jgi:Flp pilus assembly pilin Flp
MTHKANSRKIINNIITLRDRLVRFYSCEAGLAIVEYAIAASLVVAAIAVSFGVLGATIDGLIVGLNAAL